MPVKNSKDNVECDRAFYSKLDMYNVIMCNKDYKLVCNHAKLCLECGFYILKNSAMMCPHNSKGNYKDYLKETKSGGCGCGK
jgi:hypothetical protein